MKLSECKGQNFLINGKITSYQAVLKMIYEGKLFGPISLVNIDTNNDLSGVMSQMGEQEKDKSLNVLQTEMIEIDITREDVKPLNASGTLFAVEKRDPSAIYLSECLDEEYMFMCEGKSLDLSDILGMIYNKQELPFIQAIQMDTMLPHESSIAMQRLWNADGSVNNNQELSFLKNKTLIIDITPEKIEKIQGYDDLYAIKQKKEKRAERAKETEAATLQTEDTLTAPESTLTNPIQSQISTGPMSDITATKTTEPAQSLEQPASHATVTPIVQSPIASHVTDANNPYAGTPAENPIAQAQGMESEYVSLGNSSGYYNPVTTEQSVSMNSSEYNSKLKPNNDKREIPKRNKQNKAGKKVFKFLSSILGWVINIAFFIVAFYIISTHIIINAEIPSESMEPTLAVGDKIIGNRLAYSLERPERGDVAIFKNPDNPNELYIKRIIGLPGETITIKDGKIYIDDAKIPLNEPYLKDEWVEMNDGLTYEVPEGHYFMLGDNRNISYDARYWENTYVSEDALVAEAVFRYFPVNELSVINEDQSSFYMTNSSKNTETENTNTTKSDTETQEK